MKIVITGSHGTGKSTLARQYPNKLNEVARSLIEEWGHPNTFDEDKFDLFETEIIKRQISEELRLKDFISDRCVIDVLAYCTLMASPKTTRIIADKVQSYLQENTYDIIFYIPIEFEMEKDGVRYEDEQLRVIVDLQIQKYLKRYKLKYTVLTGSIEQRIETINSTILNHT